MFSSFGVNLICLVLKLEEFIWILIIICVFGVYLLETGVLVVDKNEMWVYTPNYTNKKIHVTLIGARCLIGVLLHPCWLWRHQLHTMRALVSVDKLESSILLSVKYVIVVNMWCVSRFKSYSSPPNISLNNVPLWN